jgi:hypothetical protein
MLGSAGSVSTPPLHFPDNNINSNYDGKNDGGGGGEGM